MKTPGTHGNLNEMKSTLFLRIAQLDLRSLALARILMGAILLFDLGFRALDGAAHYSDNGVLPRALLLEDSKMADAPFYLLSGSPSVIMLILAVQSLIALSLMIGFKTRASTALSWLMLMSLQNRNPYLLDSGDFLLTSLLFWSIFIPWGACGSIDAFNKPKTSNTIVSAGGLGFLFQIFFMYLFSALFKTGPEWTRELSSVYYVLSDDPWTSPLGAALRLLPTEPLTWLVVKWELFGACALLLPWSHVRTVAVVGFLLLHFGIALFLRIGIFPYICIAALTALLPGAVWDFKSPPPRARVVLNPWTAVFLFLVLIFVLDDNVRKITERWPGPASAWVEALGLRQNWFLYAPSPPKEENHFALLARFSDGSTKDVYNEVSGDRFRWRAYLASTVHSQSTSRSLGRYICRRWNDGARIQRLAEVEVHAQTRRILIHNQKSAPQDRLLWRQDCKEI